MRESVCGGERAWPPRRQCARCCVVGRYFDQCEIVALVGREGGREEGGRGLLERVRGRAQRRAHQRPSLRAPVGLREREGLERGRERERERGDRQDERGGGRAEVEQRPVVDHALALALSLSLLLPHPLSLCMCISLCSSFSLSLSLFLSISLSLSLSLSLSSRSLSLSD